MVLIAVLHVDHDAHFRVISQLAQLKLRENERRHSHEGNRVANQLIEELDGTETADHQRRDRGDFLVEMELPGAVWNVFRGREVECISILSGEKQVLQRA